MLVILKQSNLRDVFPHAVFTLLWQKSLIVLYHLNEIQNYRFNNVYKSLSAFMPVHIITWQFTIVSKSLIIIIYLFYIYLLHYTERQMPTKIFTEITQRLGAQDRYQKISLVIYSSIFLVIGASTFYNPFLFNQKEYQCPDSIVNCKDYVCSLPPDERLPFIHDSASSISSDFGDYRCNRDEINNLQTFIYFGGVIGVIICSIISKYVAKRKIMIATIIINIIGVLLTILSPTLFITGIGLFINYAAINVLNTMVQCLITETVSQSISGRYIMIAYLHYSIGVTINGVVFYLIDQWKVTLAVYIILPQAIALVGFLLFIEETPFDQITNFSAEDSLKAFNNIARINSKPQNIITLEEIQIIKRQYEENQKNKHDYAISVIDLFKYPSLRTISILFIALQFLISYEFVAPELVLHDYSLDIYWNGTIIGFSQILSAVICIFIIDDCARKKSFNIAQVLGILVSLPTFMFASCSQSVQKCGVFQTISQTSGMFLYRFFISVAYFFFSVYQFQSFPTQIRLLGLMVTSIFKCLAIVFAPLSQNLFEHLHISIIIVFALSCIFAIASTICLRETYGTPIPEMIEQLKYEHKCDIKGEKYGPKYLY